MFYSVNEVLHNILGGILPAATFGFIALKVNSEFERFLRSPGVKKYVPIEVQKYFIYSYATKYVKVISLICYTHYFRDEVRKVGKFLGIATQIILENGYVFTKEALEILSPVAISTGIFLKDSLIFITSNIFNKDVYEAITFAAYSLNRILHSGPSVAVKPIIEMVAAGLGFVLKFIKDEPWQDDFQHLCELIIMMKNDFRTKIDDFVNAAIEWWEAPSDFVDNVKYAGNIAFEKVTYILSFEIAAIGFIAGVQLYIDHVAKKIAHRQPTYGFAESEEAPKPPSIKAKVIEFLTKAALNALSIPIGQGLRDWAEEENIKQAYFNKYKYQFGEDTSSPEIVDVSAIQVLEIEQLICSATSVVINAAIENNSNSEDPTDLVRSNEDHLVDEVLVETDC